MKKFLLITIFLFFSIPLIAVDVGDEAPDFTLDKLGGGTFTLSDYRGKVVYIFWFGHDCPFCPANGNASQKNIADVYSENDVQAVGIDTWSGSNSSNVGNFKETAGISYPLLIDGRDVQNQYQVTYDRSMVIDQDGIIQYYGGTHNLHDFDTIGLVIDGLLSPTAIDDDSSPVIDFALKPNYPNPFNPETQIPFSINKTQNIKLEIYNISGQLVKTLIDAPFAKGNFEASWDGTDSQNNLVSSGVYFSILNGDGISKARQLLLIK